MLSCEDVTRLVSQSQDRGLSWRERWAVRLHLWYCLGCRRFVRQLAFLREALRRLEHERRHLRLSPSARARIRQALGQDPGLSGK